MQCKFNYREYIFFCLVHRKVQRVVSSEFISCGLDARFDAFQQFRPSWKNCSGIIDEQAQRKFFISPDETMKIIWQIVKIVTAAINKAINMIDTTSHTYRF